MTEPTQAGRALRLNAIRDRSDTAQETILSHLCDAVIDRRWLLGEIDRLQRELAEEEADREQCAIQEESKRLDVEDQLKQAERTIRDLRNQIDYWNMGQ